jgi:hypothetical protein
VNVNDLIISKALGALICAHKKTFCLKVSNLKCKFLLSNLNCNKHIYLDITVMPPFAKCITLVLLLHYNTSHYMFADTAIRRVSPASTSNRHAGVRRLAASSVKRVINAVWIISGVMSVW